MPRISSAPGETGRLLDIGATVIRDASASKGSSGRFGAAGGKPWNEGEIAATPLRLMRICLLGATGLVGRETLDLVARAWPGAELSLFASRDQQLEHSGKKYQVEAAAKLENESAPKGDLAFVALDDE